MNRYSLTRSMLTLISFVALMTAIIMGERRNEWGWSTVPSAPVLFVQSKHGLRVEYRAVGPGKVVSYDLGCVLRREGKFANTKSIQRTTVAEFRAKNGGDPMMGSLNMANDAAKECGPGGSIGIVRVDFEDGGVWQLPGDKSR